MSSVVARAELGTTRLGALPAAALGAAAAGFVGAAQGGYFPTSWSPSTLFLLWAAAVALALGRELSLTRAQVGVLTALAGLLLWTLASIAWSPSAGEPVREAEHLLVYVSAALAAPLIVRRSGAAVLLGGLLAGISAVSAYALATRLFPGRVASFDPYSGYRLATPLGYWNALGVFAAMGLLLAVGLAARAERPWARAASLAVTVPLACTLYFTFSRGAWLALAAGLAIGVAVDPRRLQLVTVVLLALAACAPVVWAASQAHALTHQGAALGEAARQGHRVAVLTVALAAAAALLGFAFAWLERRLPTPPWLRRAHGFALVGMVAVTLVVLVARAGSPPTLAARAWHAFAAAPPVGNGDLNRRLFNLSGSGRVDLWRVAWRDGVVEHPLLGVGAEGYERVWLAHRRIPGFARDAHNLYLEQLAETGPVGLALLLLALLVPAAVGVRRRAQKLVPVALAAYAAFLVHALADWDWEMTAVTLVALLVGAAILAEAESFRPAAVRGRLRGGLLAATALLIAVTLPVFLGNQLLAASGRAAIAGKWSTSARDSRRAATWAPWSAEPWQRLGEAQLAQGELAAARRSFRNAIGKDRQDWSAWLDLAVASDGAEARRALAEALRLNPLSPEIAAFRTGAAGEPVGGGTG